MQIKKVNYKKIEKISLLAVENALRLHLDSILLYKGKRYPSAYFLSIIALEEIGKYFILERIVFHRRIEGPAPFDWEKKVVNLIYNHRAKQANFESETGNDFEAFSKRNYEVSKQNSLYVGLYNRNIAAKVVNPMRIRAFVVRKQIKHLNDLIVDWCLSSYIERNVDSVSNVLTIGLAKKLILHWPYISESILKKYRPWIKYKRVREALSLVKNY